MNTNKRAHTHTHTRQERRGIVFVPPFGGVQLEAMKKDREIVIHAVKCSNTCNKNA